MFDQVYGVVLIVVNIVFDHAISDTRILCMASVKVWGKGLTICIERLRVSRVV